MKENAMLENVAKTLAGVQVGGKKGDSDLAALDRGILEIALMIAALDGTILPGEYAAFESLAKKCRGYSAKDARARLESTLAKAGCLMAMAQVGTCSESTRLATFVRMAGEALPKGFVCGSMADLRRAFALWVAMGVSDGAFSGVERKAVRALERSFALARAAKTKKFVAFFEPGFLAQAEKLVCDMAVPAKRAKAAAALESLVSTVNIKTKDGVRLRRASGGISLAAPIPGPTIPGWR